MRLSRSKSTDAAFAWLALICETHGILPIRMCHLGIRFWGCRVFFIQCAALKIYDRSVKNDSVNSSVRGWSGAAH